MSQRDCGSRYFTFDPAKLKQLLDDEKIAMGIRHKIEAVRQVISTSPRLWVRRLIEEE